MLSAFEIQEIIEHGRKVLQRSWVSSGMVSDTRTSTNGFIHRNRSHVIDTLYFRLADIMQVPDELNVPFSDKGVVEDLQFVRYVAPQEYQAHFDFGLHGVPHMRFATLLIYLQNPQAGGATAFPLAANEVGLQVLPPEVTYVYMSIILLFFILYICFEARVWCAR